MNQLNYNFSVLEDDDEYMDRICPRGTHRRLGLLILLASAAISSTGIFYFVKWVVSLFAA